MEKSKIKIAPNMDCTQDFLILTLMTVVNRYVLGGRFLSFVSCTTGLWSFLESIEQNGN